MQKIRRTWSLMADCWQVLRQDKELLLFPILSGICCVLLLASFAIPLFFTGAWMPPARDAEPVRQVLYYGILFLFYVINYFIVIFFNAAIVACAIVRMRGGNPTVAEGLRAATRRLPVIFGWALVSATVGLLLQAIENSKSKLVRIVAGLLGMTWTLVTFLVVPVLVVENKGPFAAVKESTRLLKRTWGEQLASNVSFGLIFLFLSIPAAGVVVLGVALGNAIGLAICIALAVLYLLLLGIIQAALQAIFQAALYLYAHDGEVPEGFHAECLRDAMS